VTSIGSLASAVVIAAPAPMPPITAGLIGFWDATYDAGFTYSTGGDPAPPPNTYVAQWNDLSGTGRHALGNANAGFHPKRNATINGLKAVDFSTGYVAQLKSLRVSGMIGTDLYPCTCFAVVRFPATIVNNGVIAGSSTQSITLRATSTGQVQVIIGGVGGPAASAAGVVAANGLYLIDWSHTSVAPQFNITVNATSVVSGTNTSVPTAAGTWALGAQNDSANLAFGGIIGEVLAYNVLLNSTDRTTVRNYLKAKWGTP